VLAKALGQIIQYHNRRTLSEELPPTLFASFDRAELYFVALLSFLLLYSTLCCNSSLHTAFNVFRPLRYIWDTETRMPDE
jgi:hypothetical protein